MEVNNEKNLKENGEKKGPKYLLDIEGKECPWEEDIITTEEVAQLGGWSVSDGVLLINLEYNIETTLQPGQIVELKPGIGFSKKHKFKRGNYVD